MREIKEVREIEQDGHKIYLFCISGKELLELAEIKRLATDSDGVSRLIDFTHVLKIKEAMEEKKLMLENITCQLKGWEFIPEEKVLRGDEKASLVILDGQHRIAALTFLDPAEREKWTLNITGIVSDRATQLLIADQQAKRRPLDPRYRLQIADLTGDFPDSDTARAYRILKRLNEDKNSPLFGRFWMSEKVPYLPKVFREKIEGYKSEIERIKGLHISEMKIIREVKNKINIVPVVGHLKRVLRVLRTRGMMLKEEEQYRIVRDTIIAAFQVWDKAAKNPKFYLCRTQGIGALIKLLEVGFCFLDEIGNNWKVKNIKRVLEKVKNYDWSFEKIKKDERLRFPTVYEIAIELDNLICEAGKKK